MLRRITFMPNRAFLFVCLRLKIRYKLLDDENVASAMDRAFAVPGDLSRPLLGLEDSAFKVTKPMVGGQQLRLCSYEWLIHMFRKNTTSSHVFQENSYQVKNTCSFQLYISFLFFEVVVTISGINQYDSNNQTTVSIVESRPFFFLAFVAHNTQHTRTRTAAGSLGQVLLLSWLFVRAFVREFGSQSDAAQPRFGAVGLGIAWGAWPLRGVHCSRIVRKICFCARVLSTDWCLVLGAPTPRSLRVCTPESLPGV